MRIVIGTESETTKQTHKKKIVFLAAYKKYMLCKLHVHFWSSNANNFYSFWPSQKLLPKKFCKLNFFFFVVTIVIINWLLLIWCVSSKLNDLFVYNGIVLLDLKTLTLIFNLIFLKLLRNLPFYLNLWILFLKHCKSYVNSNLFRNLYKSSKNILYF